MQRLGVSIAIVARNEAGKIVDLLESIAQLKSKVIEEVLVIDNSSEDQTISVVRAWHARNHHLNLRVLPRPSNHMAQARNLALSEAKSPWIYFTDADCRLRGSSWDIALDFMAKVSSDPGVAGFGGGNLTPVKDTFLSRGLLAMRQNWWGHMGSIQVSPPSHCRAVTLLSTCNLFVKKSWAVDCGGFDPYFERVGEDLSFCYRLQSHGAKLWALPEMEVDHEQDHGLSHWCRKIFYYGQAQIEVGCRYPRHLWGRRGLQLASMCILLTVLATLPWLFLGIFLGVSAMIMNGFRKTSLTLGERVRGVLFILLSQGFYAAGELSAILALPVRAILSFPKRMPILERTKNKTSPGHS